MCVIDCRRSIENRKEKRNHVDLSLSMSLTYLQNFGMLFYERARFSRRTP
jgi:hypothetical protein